MNEFLNFEIDPEEIPFWDDEDLGADEPRLVEWMAKKIKEAPAVHILNPVSYKRAMSIIKAIAVGVKENCPSAEFDVAFDPIIGKNLFLTIVASTMCFDSDLIDKIRNLDGGTIDSVDISARNDATVEFNISFKDIKIRLK